MGKRTWETIAPATYRLKVPGGWLYKATSDEGAKALTFVPEQAVFRQRVADALEDIVAALKAKAVP